MENLSKLENFRELLRNQLSTGKTGLEENPIEKILNQLDHKKESRLSSDAIHIVREIHNIQLRNEKHIEQIESFISHL